MNENLVDIKEVIGHVRALAEEHPDHTVNCQYVSNGEAECIVGHALHRAGVPIETLVEFDKEGNKTITQLANEVFDTQNEKELEWLRDVQAMQDYRWTWSKAVGYADVKHPLP